MPGTCDSPWHAIAIVAAVCATALSLTYIFKNNAFAGMTALPESLTGLIIVKSLKSWTNVIMFNDNRGETSKLESVRIQYPFLLSWRNAFQGSNSDKTLYSSAHTVVSLGKGKNESALFVEFYYSYTSWITYAQVRLGMTGDNRKTAKRNPRLTLFEIEKTTPKNAAFKPYSTSNQMKHELHPACMFWLHPTIIELFILAKLIYTVIRKSPGLL